MHILVHVRSIKEAATEYNSLVAISEARVYSRPIALAGAQGLAPGTTFDLTGTCAR